MKLPGLGQVNVPPLLSDLQRELSRTIVTPAERVAQYSLLGAGGAAALGLVGALLMKRPPTRSKLGLFTLLLIPVLGAAGGVYFASKAPEA